jgi:uncharacterized membrane protein YGL010W
MNINWTCALRGRWHRPFLLSSGALLLLTGSAKIWSSLGTARILAMQDELLLLNNRELMIGAGLLELVVAGVLFRCRNTVFSATVLFWLSANFALYRLGMLFTKSTICPCLGSLYEKLGLKPEVFDNLLKLIVAYFVLGSIAVLWSYRSRLQCAHEHSLNALKRMPLLKLSERVRKMVWW